MKKILITFVIAAVVATVTAFGKKSSTDGAKANVDNAVASSADADFIKDPGKQF